MDERLFQEEATYAAIEQQLPTASVGPLTLESGVQLDEVEIVYQTWGALAPQADNAILVCHALSGDSDAASWWSRIVGTGRALDPDRYFIIGTNVLGGCRGSTGPLSMNPATGRPYGGEFPAITIGDMVTAQQRLMQTLGIDCPLLVCGGSMGGMQALEWARRDATKSVWLTASCARHNAMQIAFNEVARQAIFADPKFNNGHYNPDDAPNAGLAVARMIGHISYLSADSFEHKFGRQRQADAPELFQVESYLRYQGRKFTGRFDANSLIALTRAIDTYSCDSLAGSTARCLWTAFSSDWLYLPSQSEELHAMALAAELESHLEVIDLPFGHDSFLLDDQVQAARVTEFLG